MILEETEYDDADSLFQAVTGDMETAVDNGQLEDKIQSAASSDSEVRTSLSLSLRLSLSLSRVYSIG